MNFSLTVNFDDSELSKVTEALKILKGEKPEIKIKKKEKELPAFFLSKLDITRQTVLTERRTKIRKAFESNGYKSMSLSRLANLTDIEYHTLYGWLRDNLVKVDGLIKDPKTKAFSFNKPESITEAFACEINETEQV